MTKNEKIIAWIVGIAVVIAILIILVKPKNNSEMPTSPEENVAPYYLTYNTQPPGATNIGAPYYGAMTFNRGCGCDNSRNTSENEIITNTGNNNQLSSAVDDPRYSYITSIIKAL